MENTGRFDHIMANIQTLFLGTRTQNLYISLRTGTYFVLRYGTFSVPYGFHCNLSYPNIDHIHYLYTVAT